MELFVLILIAVFIVALAAIIRIVSTEASVDELIRLQSRQQQLHRLEKPLKELTTTTPDYRIRFSMTMPCLFPTKFI